MKKLVFMFAAIVAISFASCTEKTEGNAQGTDSTATEVAADTTATTDSTATETTDSAAAEAAPADTAAQAQ